VKTQKLSGKGYTLCTVINTSWTHWTLYYIPVLDLSGGRVKRGRQPGNIPDPHWRL